MSDEDASDLSSAVVLVEQLGVPLELLSDGGIGVVDALEIFHLVERHVTEPDVVDEPQTGTERGHVDTELQADRMK